MSTRKDDKWPVEVFRYSHEKGWELFQQASSDDDEKVTASPRRGCIEVRKLRLRVHILQSQQASNPPNESKHAPRIIAQRRKIADNTSVARRRDTILLSRGDFGAVILKFESVAACISFVDRVINLNHDLSCNRDEEIVSNVDSNDARGNTIQSHMMALLHSDDFQGFVDRIENMLSSNDDCTRMMHALAYPRVAREWLA